MKQNQVGCVKDLLVLFLFVVNYFVPGLIIQFSHEAPGTHLLSVLTFNLESGFLYLFLAPCELGVHLLCHPHVMCGIVLRGGSSLGFWQRA